MALERGRIRGMTVTGGEGISIIVLNWNSVSEETQSLWIGSGERGKGAMEDLLRSLECSVIS